MNRRHFLELLGSTIAAGTVAYSFPSVIVPQNLIWVPKRLPYGMTMLDIAPLHPSVPITVGHDYGYNNAPQGLIYIIDNGARVLQAWHPYVPVASPLHK